jgi:hypothetical protein
MSIERAKVEERLLNGKSCGFFSEQRFFLANIFFERKIRFKLIPTAVYFRNKIPLYL